jgi:hypothetical protein
LVKKIETALFALTELKTASWGKLENEAISIEIFYFQHNSKQALRAGLAWET